MSYKKTECALFNIGLKFGVKLDKEIPAFFNPNFITKEKVGCYKTKNSFYFELSYGFMIDHYIYGLTFANSVNKINSKISKCCHSLKEVEEELELFTTLKK